MKATETIITREIDWIEGDPGSGCVEQVPGGIAREGWGGNG